MSIAKFCRCVCFATGHNIRRAMDGFIRRAMDGFDIGQSQHQNTITPRRTRPDATEEAVRQAIGRWRGMLQSAIGQIASD
jgi:hypothetical protein